MANDMKYISNLVVKSEPVGDREEISIITTGDVDQVGDIIDPAGVNWAPFQEAGGPVCVEHTSFKIATTEWVKPYSMSGSHGWTAKSKYLTSTLAKEVYSLIKRGVFLGKSIGGYPVEVRPPTEEEARRGAKRIITKYDAYEYSVCKIPCNMAAQVIAKMDPKMVSQLVDIPTHKVLYTEADILNAVNKALRDRAGDLMEIASGKI